MVKNLNKVFVGGIVVLGIVIVAVLLSMVGNNSGSVVVPVYVDNIANKIISSTNGSDVSRVVPANNGNQNSVPSTNFTVQRQSKDDLITLIATELESAGWQIVKTESSSDFSNGDTTLIVAKNNEKDEFVHVLIITTTNTHAVSYMYLKK